VYGLRVLSEQPLSVVPENSLGDFLRDHIVKNADLLR